MALLSLLKRKDDAGHGASAAPSGDAVQAARTRARRRLIGAAVLLGIGIVGFPLLFETTPRPVPVDVPIEIPRKEGAAPLPMPTPRAAASAARPVVVAEAASAAPAAVPRAEDKPADRPAPAASTEAVKPSPEARPEPKPEAKPTPKPTPKPEPKPSPKPTPKPTPKPAAAQEANRALAALEDKPAAPPVATGMRFVVQVGAFTGDAAAKEARQKAQKLGLHTYTQVVEVEGGKRIRVRVGPFSSRDDADKAAAKLKGGGLQAAVLTL